MISLKNWKRYLPIIGIALFVYILIKVDILTVIQEVKNVKIYYLLVAVLFVFLVTLFGTLKWYAIAFFQDIKIPFLEALKINFISNYYGFITPSKLGSVVRAEYLKKYTEKENIGKGLFNFIIDKILDISSVILMAIFFSFIFRDIVEIPIIFFTALFLSFVLITLYFIKKERSKSVLRFFGRKFVPNKFKDKFILTFESFYEHVPKKRYFILFFILNLINWVVIYLTYYFIGLSFGIDISFIYYLAIFPIGTLVSMIPISVGGLGTREVTLISLFALFGIKASKVFSMSITGFLIMGIIPSIIAIFLTFKKRL